MHKTRHHQKAFAFATRCPDHVRVELDRVKRRLQETAEHRKRALAAAARLESWQEVCTMCITLQRKK